MHRPGSMLRSASTAAGGRHGPIGWARMPARSSPHRAEPATPNARPSRRRLGAMSRRGPSEPPPPHSLQPQETRMTDIVIVAAQRTAVGKFGGTLAKTAAPDLGAHVIKGLLAKTGIPGDAISEVIMGQVLTAGSGQNPARQTVIKAGLLPSVPGMTINKVCGSGLKAVMLAAAAVLVMSAERAAALGLKPLAVIRAYASAGLDPSIMGMGPVPASRLCLKKAGWTAHELDLMEINEAFAAQACAVNQEMGWDTSRINVNGGAIAIGHPIGASGCRVLVTLLHEMRRRGANKGLASLCIGGGMGVALAVERA